MVRILARSAKYVDFQIKNDCYLVQCVKRHPIIYDKKNLLFLNRKMQKRIWEYIAKILQSTAKECEERWIALLDIYEKCKILHKNGTSIMMHDVLIEQLDDLFNSIPEDITCGLEVDMLNYDFSQIFEVREEMNDSPSPVTSEEHSFIFLTGVKEDFEDGAELEACFSELLDEASAVPPSKTYKGI